MSSRTVRDAARDSSSPGPSPRDAHEIRFYRDDDGRLPAREYLQSLPTNIRARIRAVAIEVAAAPPMRFSGGGYWEAMHGDMTGWFEIRVDGHPNRSHYRVFCLLDYDSGEGMPLLVLVAGRTKPFRTTLRDSDYAAIRALGDRYRALIPRPLD